MKSRTTLAVAAAVTALGGIAWRGPSTPTQGKPARAVVARWEFKVLGALGERRLNQLGEDGRELAATPVQPDVPFSSSIFKRPKR